MFSADPYNGPTSDHFDGQRFRNQESGWHTSGDFWRWMRERQKAPWPKWVDVPNVSPLPNELPANATTMRATFINHATVLLQTPGVTLITDPIWSERCSPVSFLGPKRVHRPGVPFEALPKVDVVLISHNHYDHMDLPTLRRLMRQFHPRFYSGLGNKKFLEERGIAPVTELDWWQSIPLNDKTQLTFVPGRHFSARGLKDRNFTLWGGYVISQTAAHGKRQIYFAGDTAYGMHFKQLYEKFGAMDFSLLPIGAYEPRWFMKMAHVNPEEAVRAHGELHSKKSLGIHFGTFQLTDEARDEPVLALERAKKQQGVADADFMTLSPGASYEF